ncbi:MAG: nicotinate phosphoribosyltransferase, partial [Actinobacteria bacterium]|nr:nicotinate phosphoribosyltransferase [Actinomycetota bacterium]
PSLDIIYKLVEYDGVAHAKYSASKVSLPGAKQVFRVGDPTHDVLGLRDEELAGDELLAPIWRDGKALVDVDLCAARERARAQLATLPRDWRHPADRTDVPRPELSAGLQALVDEVRTRELAR